MTNILITGDSGPSGFGVATVGVVRSLIKHSDINVSFKTHKWPINNKGRLLTNNPSDTRWVEELIRDGNLNRDFLLDDVRKMSERNKERVSLSTEETHDEIPSEDLMIKGFEGKEDVRLAIGGMNLSERMTDDPSVYKIVSTDWNLDIVPRVWEHYINQVDEVWVPSEWTRQSILNRVGDDYEDKIHSFHYGINQNYRPTEYDCHVCGHQRAQGQGNPSHQQCLRDGSTNFMVVSRFYHIKGLYRTIKAYIEEFRSDDDVRLFIKTTSNGHFKFNPVQSAQAVVQELGYPDPPEIGFAIEGMKTQYLYDIMGHCDAFFQCSRAECFGIAQVQAAYCGTPVIYTNWSSQKELFDESNKGLLPINDFEVKRPERETEAFVFDRGNTFPPDSNWAVPSIEGIQKKMREIYEMSQEEKNKRGKEAQRYASENFRWEDKIQPRIKRIKEAANE